MRCSQIPGRSSDRNGTALAGATKLGNDINTVLNEADSESGAADAGPPSARSIEPGNLKNVEARRVEKVTCVNPLKLKELLGEKAPIAKYDLKRDPR
jgi:hypothetical protein